MQSSIHWLPHGADPVHPRASRFVAAITSTMLHGFVIVLLVMAARNGSPPRVSTYASHESPMAVQRLEARSDDIPALSPTPGIQPPHLRTTRERCSVPPRHQLQTFPTSPSSSARLTPAAPCCFPFCRPVSSLDQFGPSRAESRSTHQRTLADAERSSAPDGPPTATARRLTALQSVVDRSWSRRYRWNAFQAIVTLAESHSGD